MPVLGNASINVVLDQHFGQLHYTLNSYWAHSPIKPSVSHVGLLNKCKEEFTGFLLLCLIFNKSLFERGQISCYLWKGVHVVICFEISPDRVYSLGQNFQRCVPKKLDSWNDPQPKSVVLNRFGKHSLCYICFLGIHSSCTILKTSGSPE